MGNIYFLKNEFPINYTVWWFELLLFVFLPASPELTSAQPMLTLVISSYVSTFTTSLDKFFICIITISYSLICTLTFAIFQHSTTLTMIFSTWFLFCKQQPTSNWTNISFDQLQSTSKLLWICNMHLFYSLRPISILIMINLTNNTMACKLLTCIIIVIDL